MRLAVLTKGSFRAIDCTHSTQEDVYLLDALPTMECWNLVEKNELTTLP